MIVYLCPRADHPSLLKPTEFLINSGVELKFIPMREDGGIRHDELLQQIDNRTKLIILSFVNNQSGTINDVNSIASEVKKICDNVHIHVDGVQGFCKIPISLSTGVVDSFSVSSHKIGGPKGCAALYLRKGKKVVPLLSGGGQEGGMRSSTRPAPLILAFAEAVKYLSDRYRKDFDKVSRLNNKVKKTLKNSIPGISFPFTGDEVSPYILNIIIPGISSDIIVRHLEEKDIYISTTSACSSGDKGENAVFRALGIKKGFHNNVYRVSFSVKTDESEVDIFCKEIGLIYNDLSSIL